MWHWYVSKPTEIFVDADNWSGCKHHTAARLQGAIECKKLNVKDVHLFPSQTSGHMHMIVELNYGLTEVEKAVWAVLFHSDIYRACSTIMRHIHNVKAPDVLITRKILHRLPDAHCDCTSKHIYEVMERCTAAVALRGEFRTLGFFGKPSKNKCKFLP